MPETNQRIFLIERFKCADNYQGNCSSIIYEQKQQSIDAPLPEIGEKRSQACFSCDGEDYCGKCDSYSTKVTTLYECPLSMGEKIKKIRDIQLGNFVRSNPLIKKR